MKEDLFKATKSIYYIHKRVVIIGDLWEGSESTKQIHIKEHKAETKIELIDYVNNFLATKYYNEQDDFKHIKGAEIVIYTQHEIKLSNEPYIYTKQPEYDSIEYIGDLTIEQKKALDSTFDRA